MSRKYFLKGKSDKEKTEVDYNEELNPEQREVVFSGEGPCLVLAGPGSGKTRTLIYRLAYLLEKGVPENKILLMTFTKKAAEEMVKRTNELIGYEPQDLWAGTFHHIGNLVLRKHAEKLGYERNYAILDSKDSLDLLRVVIEDNDLMPEEKYFPKPKLLKGILDRKASTGYSWEKTIREFFPFVEENAPDFEEVLSTIQKIQKFYQQRKQNQNLMDFNDLLLNWRSLMEDYPEVREKMDKRFEYVLVDEFQDTSPLQASLIHLLSKDISNVLVVGDDSQSIYSFRGATIDNIFGFKKEFNPKIFKLETNYRSTPSILDVANNSIKQNEKRFDKTLRAKKEEGSMPVVVPLKDTEEQARFVTQRILELNREEGISLSDIGVLYRSHFQSGEIELELARKGIPYIIRSGIKFHERKHIKDILSFFRILLNFKEELSWRRLLKLQPGVGGVYSARIYSQIAEKENLEEALKLEPEGLTNRAERGWNQLKEIFEKILPMWEETPEDYLNEITKKVLKKHYKKYLVSNFENADQRLEDIEHLSMLMSRYEDVEEFLSAVSLSESFSAQRAKGYQEGYDENVVLSTVHQAKGLEWDTVFVVGLLDGWFPHWKSKDSESELEEERRIFYVAVTRAKNQLYLTFPITSKRRTGSGLRTISTFLQEINENLYQQWRVEEILPEIEED